MILNMDKIQFENRAEIGAIIKALEEWQEDHGYEHELVKRQTGDNTISSVYFS